MYRVKVNKKILKFINTLQYQKTIIEKLSLLKKFKSEEILYLDIKKLTENKKNIEEYRLKIGDLRFIFEIKEEEKLIEITKADYRGNIYS